MKRLTWENVIAVLDDPENASAAFTLLRARQIKASETWGQTATKEAVADALTAAEDRLEHAHPRSRDRARIRAVRRRLEVEVS